MQLSHNGLMDAYKRMKRIRDFEERVVTEFENGNIPGFLHVYAGQEASGVGVCVHLTDADYIGSTHRGHGHCIAKGCDIHGMMLEIFGKKEGLCGGKGGSMHIADMSKGMLGANAIVGGSPPLVIGSALSAKTLGTGAVGVAFTGDGGSNQGTVFEAMNMAVVLALPAIFVIENNGYGECTGVNYASAGVDLAARAGSFGMPAVTVDGHDFFAVYEAAGEAIERARQGKGPSVIVTECMRFYGHFVGDPQSYRHPDEVPNLRRNKDPLILFRSRVIESGRLTASALDAIDAEVGEEVESAVRAASAGAPPTPSDLLTDVYVQYS
jgi:acetoin:2,6-dichlorophenolindophenol oxidoreductase subunit alpha